MTAILDERPLCLRIETTSICNARCVFCAYPKSGRPKSVMPPALFEKIIRDYAELGGGAVSLTPIVGDALLDPHLLDRLRLLRGTPAVTRISLITNAIAWPRLSRSDRLQLLQSLDTIDVSTGGPDRDGYRRLYAVDRFETVQAAVAEMCTLKRRHDLPLRIHIALRVDRPRREVLDHEALGAFRRPEIDSISVMNEFGNWGGMVRAEDLPDGARLIPLASPEETRRRRRHPCFVHFMNPEITCEGKVAVCICGNAQTPELIIGDVTRESLGEIWRGPRRQRLIESYGTDTLNEICLSCTAYQDGLTWLHHPALADFTVGDDPWERVRDYRPPPPADRLTRILHELAR
ncbi:MAG: radical SAM protein, partial [Planctomycetota bacterium]